MKKNLKIFIIMAIVAAFAIGGKNTATVNAASVNRSVMKSFKLKTTHVAPGETIQLSLNAKTPYGLKAVYLYFNDEELILSSKGKQIKALSNNQYLCTFTISSKCAIKTYSLNEVDLIDKRGRGVDYVKGEETGIWWHLTESSQIEKTKCQGSSNLKVHTHTKGTKLTSVKPGKKQMVVKWKPINQLTKGYQIQYSTTKNFSTGTKTTYVNGTTKSAVTLKGLKSKKSYYVRIRTYKTDACKSCCSKWSAAKKVTIK